MRISYRQGLLSAQSNFLQIGQDDSRFVDIIVSPTPTVATAAFKSVNYLISEQRTVTNAWGPFNTTQTQYLYWEINQFNGAITRASTTLPPLVLGSAPENPAVEQMWFDTAENLMKVFNGFEWNPVIRVFAGTLQSGAILQPQPFASQVGLNSPSNAGYVMQDGFGNAFRSSNGALLTSDTQLSSNDTGSLVKIQGSELYALANENLPKFSAVYLISGRAALASGSPEHSEARAPVAVVTADFYQNETATLVTGGRSISNDQWNFPIADIGKNVYCGANGELTLVKPLTKKYIRVGTVVNAQTVMLTLEWITELMLAENSITNVSATAPLVKTGTNNIVVSIPQANNVNDGFISASDFARIGLLEIDLTTKAPLVHTHGINEVINLQTVLDDKAPLVHQHTISDIASLTNELNLRALVNHTHVIGDVTGLQTAINSINSAIALKSDKVIGAVIGHLAALDATGNLVDSGSQASDFAAVNHLHPMADVTGLIAALDSKADVDHTQEISSINGLTAALNAKADVDHTQEISSINGLTTVLGNKSDINHTHQIADVQNLQNTIDGKANVVHNHGISAVLGLQSALDDKANVVHTHGINEVTGLQLALDSKSNVNHVHEITEVNGLVDALATKAATVHTHEISDVNNLQTALDDKAPVSHMHTLANNLSDVDVLTVPPTSGDSLVWNGTHWAPAAVSGGGGGGRPIPQGKILRLTADYSNPLPDGRFMYYNNYNSNMQDSSGIYWDDATSSIVIPTESNPLYHNTIWKIHTEYNFSVRNTEASPVPVNWVNDITDGATPRIVKVSTYLNSNTAQIQNNYDTHAIYIATGMEDESFTISKAATVMHFQYDGDISVNLLLDVVPPQTPDPINGDPPRTVGAFVDVDVFITYVGDGYYAVNNS